MVFALRNIVRSNAGYVKKYWFYKENLPIISVRHHSYDPDGKTTVQILNRNVEGLMINSYSQFGFRLNNGMYILGPMAIFPRTVLSWNVGSERDINEDSLSLFCLLEPKIALPCVGSGRPKKIKSDFGPYKEFLGRQNFPSIQVVVWLFIHQSKKPVTKLDDFNKNLLHYIIFYMYGAGEFLMPQRLVVKMKEEAGFKAAENPCCEYWCIWIYGNLVMGGSHKSIVFE
ncbi:uncharacterized protein LOC110829308 isoform X2 [Zootermopsis nevadensis]|uniref:uncharacterized protein LOC110829308 isoform X2 n=1 Tax=Zootermopsis nevadensis TaxID=136037 RepID=UPI000B8EB276|nr:uncharacterized protein LOC110829308 isoform X2 [Zootermopsis nevadensis]